MLEILLMVVAVEDRESEHAACDLLRLLLQLCQMLLGVICKSPGGELRARWGIIISPSRPLPTPLPIFPPTHLWAQGSQLACLEQEEPAHLSSVALGVRDHGGAPQSQSWWGPQG